MKLTREQVLLSNAIGMLLEELHGNDEVDKQYLIENLGITEEELSELDVFDNVDEKFEKHLATEIETNGISDASFVVDYCNFIPKDGKEYLTKDISCMNTLQLIRWSKTYGYFKNKGNYVSEENAGTHWLEIPK